MERFIYSPTKLYNNHKFWLKSKMKKIKKLNQIKVLLLLILLVALLPPFSFVILENLTSNTSNSKAIDKFNVESSDWWDLGVDRIIIDGIATGVGAHNWTWAESQDWCNGLGTWTSPYIIENITIDGQGHDNGIDIRNSDVYFTLQNSTIYNCGNSSNHGAIKLVNVQKGTIYNNTLFNNYNGIYSSNGDNLTISENLIKNSSYRGIHSSVASIDVLIIGNTLEGSGIRIYGDSHTVIGNTINGTGYGIYSYADNHNITGNTITNSSMGIQLETSEGHNIEGNHLNNNNYGIHLSYVRDSNFTSNELNDNKEHGIYFYSMCYDNNFTDNSLTNSGVGVASTTFDNMILNEPIDSSNTVNSRPIYFYVNETGFGANMFINAGQILLINCNDSLISNANTSYCTYGTSLFYCYNITMTGCDISNNNRYGLYIEHGAYNKLLSSTVNYNGLDTDGGGIEIYDSPYTYLYNNTVTYSFRDGIRISQSNHSSIIDNIVNNNGIHYASGLYLYYSGYCEVIGNTANDNWEMGIWVEGSYCNITKNVANGNEHGIHIYGEYNNITGNTANLNDEKGFSTWADYNNFTKNTANLNGEDGFYFQESDFHTLYDNYASNNNYAGFHFLWCNNVTILENTVENHVSYGIYVDRSESHTIMDNNLLNNEDGVFLQDSKYIIVSNNIMQGDTGVYGWGLYHSKIIENALDDNTQSGITVQDGGDLLISNNTMNYCYNALYLGTVIDSIILNNDINMNIERGIWIYQCDNIDILDNTASFNVYGLWVSESTNLFVTGNTFNNNSEHGIVFVSATDNEITTNTINGNTQYAIYLMQDSNDNTISHNQMIWNEDCIVEEDSAGNTIYSNICENRPSPPPTDGDGTPPIPGYDVLLLTVISIGTLIYLLRKRKSKIKHN